MLGDDSLGHEVARSRGAFVGSQARQVEGFGERLLGRRRAVAARSAQMPRLGRCHIRQDSVA